MEPKRNIEAEIRKRKKEKDERDACIFTLIFCTIFQVAMIIGDMVLVGLTVAFFVVILFMEERKEKVEKRLEVITRAYNEQLRIQSESLRYSESEPEYFEEDYKEDCDDYDYDYDDSKIMVTKGGRVA